MSSVDSNHFTPPWAGCDSIPGLCYLPQQGVWQRFNDCSPLCVLDSASKQGEYPERSEEQAQKSSARVLTLPPCSTTGSRSCCHLPSQGLLPFPFSRTSSAFLGISCFRASLANAEGQGETLLPGLIQICNNLVLISINSAEITQSDPFISQGWGNEERSVPCWLNSSFLTKHGDDRAQLMHAKSNPSSCSFLGKRLLQHLCQHVSLTVHRSLWGLRSPAVQLLLPPVCWQFASIKRIKAGN